MKKQLSNNLISVGKFSNSFTSFSAVATSGTLLTSSESDIITDDEWKDLATMGILLETETDLIGDNNALLEL